MITVVQQAVGRWQVSAVVFSSEKRRIPIPVGAIIGNSVAPSAAGKAVLVNWKRAVAATAKQARGAAPLNPDWTSAVSAGFSFHMPSHGNHIFDRFYKSKDSRGTGLGLTIAKSLVVAHGGEIAASSELGRGTMICFALPLDPGAGSR
ncbi:MAG TPA: ATP-binding protein [Anaerolineales bacterium]|nr:ATP-binding protein [Anaerolineales bacterium]